ncbi:hypothetical protein NMY22_g11099 [Coprinellus aureogranulatus]|nr:hypothetical protein NMY22_g11099 [Coprinellus aureogranulatus]
MGVSLRSLLFLHGLSLFASTGVLCLTFFDTGILSLWCNPIFGLGTLSFHLRLLSTLLLTRSPSERPLYASKGCIIAAFSLSFCWLAAFFAMIFVYETQADGLDYLAIGGIQFGFPHTQSDLQKIQFMLVPVEWIILCDLGFRTTIYRHGAPNYRNWGRRSFHRSRRFIRLNWDS